MHDIRYLHMVLGGLVERRSNHLRLHAACHIRHLLRTLVNEQDYHIHLRVVGCNGIGYLLEQHRLTCLRLCHNQSALTLANRSKQIDDTHRQRVALVAFAEFELLIREERCQVLKRNTLTCLRRRDTVDAYHLFHGEVLVRITRRTNGTLHRVAGLQTVLLNLLCRNIYVIGR